MSMSLCSTLKRKQNCFFENRGKFSIRAVGIMLSKTWASYAIIVEMLVSNNSPLLKKPSL